MTENRSPEPPQDPNAPRLPDQPTAAGQQSAAAERGEQGPWSENATQPIQRPQNPSGSRDPYPASDYPTDHSGSSHSPWWGSDQHAETDYEGASAEQPHPARARRFGAGTLVTGMVLAALVGGGVAAGTTALVSQTQSASTADGGSGAHQGTTIVNDRDSVNAVTAAAEKASPSTVTISVTGRSASGSGSGVVLDDQGHILTNTHVVTLDGTSADPAIEVQFSNGTVRSAEIVGTDPSSDLAVIKVDPSGLNLTPADMGDSESINVGDTVVAIGSPLGLEGTVTDGIVSNLNRTIAVASSAAPKSTELDESQQGGQMPFRFEFPDQNGGTSRSQASSTIQLNVLQTDAAINPGNSGGPLVNTDGEVIGINVAIASAGSGQSSSGQTGNIGVGFAVPVDYAQRVAHEIIDQGSASHGLLGATVSSSPANSDSSRTFTDGAVIREVSLGGPAAEAGLKAGDVITAVDGRRTADANALTATIRQYAAGKEVEVTYLRNGRESTTKVTLGSAE